MRRSTNTGTSTGPPAASLARWMPSKAAARVLPGLLIAAFALTSGLTGCGGGGQTESATTAPSARGGSSTGGSSTSPTPVNPAVPGPRSITVGSAELVGASQGWAADGERLLWTDDDGRSWTDITPPGVPHFGYVHFLDRRHGWLSTAGSPRRPRLAIYGTDDGGRSWFRGRVSGPPQPTISDVVISFADRSYGWTLVDHDHGSGVLGDGSLYRTVDGGRRWRFEGTTPTDGRILFTSPRDGWVAGSALAGERLFHTDDGGRHWTRVHFRPPPGTSAERPDYGMPLVLAGGRVVVPVLLNDAAETTRIGLYSPAGRGWRLDRLVTLRGSISGGAAESVSLLPPSSVLIRDPGALPPIRVDLAGGRSSVSRLRPRGLPSQEPMHFVDRGHGVVVARLGDPPCRSCRTEGNLFFTGDGGRRWTRRPVHTPRSTTGG